MCDFVICVCNLENCNTKNMKKSNHISNVFVGVKCCDSICNRYEGYYCTEL